MAQSAEAMAARMGEGAETALTRITDQISGLMETLRAVTAQTRDAGAEAAQILARQSGALAETAEKLAARIGELDRATKEAVAPFAAGAADLCRTAEAAQAATTRLVPVGSSLGAAAEQIGRAAQRFDAAQAGAAKLSQEVAAAAQRFEGVDRSLAATLSALGSALDGFRQRIQDFVTNTDQNLAKAATNVAAMIRQLEAALEEHSSTRH
jgi:chromosome segregation ATPase